MDESGSEQTPKPEVVQPEVTKATRRGFLAGFLSALGAGFLFHSAKEGIDKPQPGEISNNQGPQDEELRNARLSSERPTAVPPQQVPVPTATPGVGPIETPVPTASRIPTNTPRPLGK